MWGCSVWVTDLPDRALHNVRFLSCGSVAALESKLVSQFCEDENGDLIYNRLTNGNNGHSNSRNGNNGRYAEGVNRYQPATDWELLNTRQSNNQNHGDSVATFQYDQKGSSTGQVLAVIANVKLDRQLQKR